MCVHAGAQGAAGTPSGKRPPCCADPHARTQVAVCCSESTRSSVQGSLEKLLGQARTAQLHCLLAGGWRVPCCRRWGLLPGGGAGSHSKAHCLRSSRCLGGVLLEAPGRRWRSELLSSTQEREWVATGTSVTHATSFPTPPGDDVPQPKPDPTIFTAAAKELGVQVRVRLRYYYFFPARASACWRKYQHSRSGAPLNLQLGFPPRATPLPEQPTGPPNTHTRPACPAHPPAARSRQSAS